jgi:epoxyqueuosine reductase
MTFGRTQSSALTAAVKVAAREAGCDLVGIAPAVTPLGFTSLQAWLARGYAGEMQYLPRREAAYEHPRHVLDGVRSVVLVGVNYKAESDEAKDAVRLVPSPLSSGERVRVRGPGGADDGDEQGRAAPSMEQRTPAEKTFAGASGLCGQTETPVPDGPLTLALSPEAGARGQARAATVSAQVARYAQGPADYHDVLKDRLRAVAEVLHELAPGCRTRAVVDTAPLLERDFARLAGLGWFGKNTMLIHKRSGSYLLLGALLTDVELDYDQPHHTSHCGTCTRCLDVCPTDAFPEPYQLDARKCISYLTIELKGPIPADLRSGIGDWLFGCDLCQDVCPWNRKSPTTDDPVFQPRADLAPADALDMLRLTRDEFRLRFRNSPLARPGYNGLRRNAAIVLGNSGDAAAVPDLIATLSDADPVVRGAVAWALGQLGGDAARTALQERRGIEDNPTVLQELDAALQHHNSTDAQG